MRSLLRAIGVAAVVSACGGGPGGACDLAALRAAADATDEMMRVWDPRSGVLPDYGLAVRGMQGACPGLPRGFAAFFEQTVQPQPRAGPRRVCPRTTCCATQRPCGRSAFIAPTSRRSSTPSIRCPGRRGSRRCTTVAISPSSGSSPATTSPRRPRISRPGASMRCISGWSTPERRPRWPGRSRVRSSPRPTSSSRSHATSGCRRPRRGPHRPGDAATLLVTSYMVTVDHQQLGLAHGWCARRRGPAPWIRRELSPVPQVPVGRAAAAWRGAGETREPGRRRGCAGALGDARPVRRGGVAGRLRRDPRRRPGADAAAAAGRGAAGHPRRGAHRRARGEPRPGSACVAAVATAHPPSTRSPPSWRVAAGRCRSR
jgi:hypothetical protein